MNALLVTPEEAARVLCISRTRLYELLAEGRIRSVTLGRSRRIPRAALEEFVDALGAGRATGAVTRLSHGMNK